MDLLYNTTPLSYNVSGFLTKFRAAHSILAQNFMVSLRIWSYLFQAFLHLCS